MFPLEVGRIRPVEDSHPATLLPPALQAGCVTLEPRARRATVDGRSLHLTTIEYDMLALLVERAGRKLRILLMTRRSDPRFGETVYRLTNIVRSEPSADLFRVPAGFKVEDMRPGVKTPLKPEEQ